MKLAKRLRLSGVAIGAAAILATTATIATSAASAAPSRPAVPRCFSVNTSVWTGFPGDGFAGGVGIQLEISNIGHHPCTFIGYPGVSALNAAGHQVGLPASERPSSEPLVTLPPGGTTHVVLIIHDAGIVCPGHAVHGVELRVYAPNQFGSERTPFSVDVCKHKVNMDVDAVHPGAGIPGFSAS